MNSSTEDRITVLGQSENKNTTNLASQRSARIHRTGQETCSKPPTKPLGVIHASHSNRSADSQPRVPNIAVSKAPADMRREDIRPDVVQFVNVPKSHVNHTYRNFSNVPLDPNYSLPGSITLMSFHEKLYHLLSSESVGSRQSINWCHHGRAFELTSPSKLVRFGILHAYFGYGMMQQFRKQLHRYGYKQLVRGVGEKESYYSEFLLRGHPHLLQYSPPPEDRRTLRPDPDHEPNFAEISRLYPLSVNQRDLVEEARANLEAKGIYIYQHVFDSVVARRLGAEGAPAPH